MILKHKAYTLPCWELKSLIPGLSGTSTPARFANMVFFYSLQQACCLPNCPPCPRSCEPCHQVILINSASYSGWTYRWQCLEAVYRDNPEGMRGEHHFLERIAAINVKNYQLWNHRRQLAFCQGPEAARQVRNPAIHFAVCLCKARLHNGWA